MELKEIQIGDLVRVTLTDLGEDKIFKVTEYIFDRMITESKVFNDMRIDPVKLTEWHLKLNGFVKIGSALIKSGKLNFVLNQVEENQDNFWFDFGGHQILVEHVHRLQHLLRDCGMDDVADSLILNTMDYADQERE